MEIDVDIFGRFLAEILLGESVANEFQVSGAYDWKVKLWKRQVEQCLTLCGLSGLDRSDKTPESERVTQHSGCILRRQLPKRAGQLNQVVDLLPFLSGERLAAVEDAARHQCVQDILGEFDGVSTDPEDRLRLLNLLRPAHIRDR
ncbi:MAG TPA: hypothetical protein PLC22_01195 [Gordonia sp. (in: high G+C Gram-positive bacteria)]|nr:hypothetical protein [Gordonia sp. (in: high G+C Gram-positive bacteria)]